MNEKLKKYLADKPTLTIGDLLDVIDKDMKDGLLSRETPINVELYKDKALSLDEEYDEWYLDECQSEVYKVYNIITWFGGDINENMFSISFIMTED
jgi:hypothetical protein